MMDELTRLQAENTRLRELLEECRPVLRAAVTKVSAELRGMEDHYGAGTSDSCRYALTRLDALLTRIQEEVGG